MYYPINYGYIEGIIAPDGEEQDAYIISVDKPVKELCTLTPVARTTFYFYYNNIDDVKNEIEDQIIIGLLEVTETISEGNIPDMDFMKFLDAT